MEQESLNTATIDHDKIARLERFSTQFANGLEKLEKERKKIEENLPKITLEIEELKSIQQKLIPVLSEAVKKSLKEERREFSKKAAEELKNNLERSFENCRSQAESIYEKYREEVRQFKREIEKTTSTLSCLLSLQKQRLTYRGLLICGVFCLASLSTGAGLFYFFPQHVYNPDKNIAKYIIMGKIVRDNYAKLSSKDQEMFLEEMKKYVR